jgi:hypothetical protein
VVVDSHREGALGGVLADHVLVQHLADLARLRQVLQLEDRRRGEFLVDDLVTEIDALVADVDAGAGDQFLDLALRLAAEAAEELFVRVCRACQLDPSSGWLVCRPTGAFSLDGKARRLGRTFDYCEPHYCGRLRVPANGRGFA